MVTTSHATGLEKTRLEGSINSPVGFNEYCVSIVYARGIYPPKSSSVIDSKTMKPANMVVTYESLSE